MENRESGGGGGRNYALLLKQCVRRKHHTHTAANHDTHTLVSQKVGS